MKDCLEIFQNLQKCILPELSDLENIFEKSSDILISEENVLHIDSPVNVIGDLHGQYYDFLKIIDLYGLPSETNKYLFLGDFVDRGLNSVELMISVLILKIVYTEQVFLIRGNHESKSMGINYTFRDECRLKYNDSVFLQFCEIFTFLPICAVVNKKIFCIHGGITPDFNIEELKYQDRFEELPSFNDVYWSDPDEDIMGFEESSRGAGYLFGEKAVEHFLESNNMQCIIRSHQLVDSGFDSKFAGKVLTVWSAPNYVYSHGNGASILKIDGNNITPEYFTKAEPQYIKDKTYEFFQLAYNG